MIKEGFHNKKDRYCFITETLLAFDRPQVSVVNKNCTLNHENKKAVNIHFNGLIKSLKKNYLPRLAFTKLTNNGCGFSTVLLYSG